MTPGVHAHATRAVYTAESQMRSPLALVAAMAADVWRSRELAWRLFIRDLAAQYRQSVLGPLWMFVTPIVTSLIFIVLHARNVVNFGAIDIPYPVYVVVGTILWQLFVESLNAPLKAVTAAKPLLAKINFPREALVVSAVLIVIYGLLIKLVVILGVLVVFDVPVGWGVAAAVGPMLILLLGGIAAGLLLTPVGMLYTDITSALPVVTQLLFFVTPVVYKPPTTFPFSLLGVVNPVSPLLMGARDLVTKGAVADPLPMLVVGLATLAALFVALVIYRVSIPILIERTSA